MTSEYLVPVRTLSIELSSEKVEIDTHGLMALVKASGGDALVLAPDSAENDDAFPISDGETFRFAGEIKVFAAKEQSCVLKIIYFDRA